MWQVFTVDFVVLSRLYRQFSLPAGRLSYEVSATFFGGHHQTRTKLFAKGLLSFHCAGCVRGGHKSQVSIYVSEGSADVPGTCWLHEAGSCQAGVMPFHWLELAWLTLYCTRSLGRTWPDMALILPSCFLSIHLYPPISRGQHQQQATHPGEELGERGHRHPLHQTVTSGGELSRPGSPSAGEQRESQKKGKATGDKQTQERATPCVGMWTLSRGYENTSKAITCQ